MDTSVLDANADTPEAATDEDGSLGYTWINRHKGEEIGLYDTVISTDDYLTYLTTCENVVEIM